MFEPRLIADDPVTEAPASWEPSPLEAQRIVKLVSQGSHVRRRFEFFAWTQQCIQPLIPHAVLICGLPRGQGTSLFFDYFHTVPLPTATLGRLCHPREGVAMDMMLAWRDAGAEPLVVDGRSQVAAHAHRALQQLGLGTTVAHGIPFDQSSAGGHGFFAMVSLDRNPGERELNLLGMIVPQLFSSYCRALTRERTTPSNASSPGDSALSGREVEILHWVREGKSNHDIGQHLSISPLTVKNHIQRILRKLGATNRTQAVTKAITMRLLADAPRMAHQELDVE